ncbi:MAG: hypothetical protein ACI9SE_000291 [Neolewinella sp.]|jgi:hypothetical protein
MISQWKRALAACAFAVFAPLTIAQSISVPGGHGGSLTGGSSISVGFADPARAGDSIKITVSNNMSGPLYEETVLVVVLDANGKGTVKWVVDSSWDMAEFVGGGAAEVVLFVN